ncbi:hypothetical protein Tsubulata_042274 [Turnera subulata]|uniref:Uncharacterized protein n=1 Tax=Turnera subulata TaxID=218843 RepID=A0A9Q0JAR4_9ROSI|nr:hypothetical protein Tsubulata_042274 [Turnera subulata]
MKSKNPFVASGEIKAGSGGDRIYHATILESPSSHHSRLPDRHNNSHYGCGCGSRSVQKITFELIMKQLMSFDPGEWTESLRKEYVLVIEGFLTVPLPLFSTTYRRAIQIYYDCCFYNSENSISSLPSSTFGRRFSPRPSCFGTAQGCAPVKPQRRRPRWLYAAAVLSLSNTTAPPRSVTTAMTEAEPSMETAAVDGGKGDANEDC